MLNDPCAPKRATSSALQKDVSGSFEDRCRGAFLGLACANKVAHGRPITKAGALRLPPLHQPVEPLDDDVALAILVAETLRVEGSVNLHDLTDRMLGWHRSNGRGIGWLTRNVLWELADGTPPEHAALVVWYRYGRVPAGNGPITRMIPVSIRWAFDQQNRWEAAERATTITHFDPRNVWSSIATAELLATLLRGDQRWDQTELARLIHSSGARTEVVNALSSPLSLDDLQLNDPSTKGYCIKALQVAMWATGRNDLPEAIAEVISRGGDVDTNASIVGAVIGARLGESRIPSEWRANGPFFDKIRKTADQLAADASQSKGEQ